MIYTRNKLNIHNDSSMDHEILLKPKYIHTYLNTYINIHSNFKAKIYLSAESYVTYPNKIMLHTKA